MLGRMEPEQAIQNQQINGCVQTANQSKTQQLPECSDGYHPPEWQEGCGSALLLLWLRGRREF